MNTLHFTYEEYRAIRDRVEAAKRAGVSLGDFSTRYKSDPEAWMAEVPKIKGRYKCAKCQSRYRDPFDAQECPCEVRTEPPVGDGSTNPKAAVGRAKPPLHAIPPVAQVWLGLGMEDGEHKYGLMNWRTRPVDAATYYDAAVRHLLAWWDGERVADDSKVHHLGHVMACCAILLDAEAQGTLVDNRPAAGMVSRLIEELTDARRKAAISS